MHVLDKFVMSQHRSMHLLHGNNNPSVVVAKATMDFMESYLLLPYTQDVPVNVSGDNHPLLNTSDTNTSLYNQTRLSRHLAQMDDSIRRYSSIISATKQYSKIEVGKTAITDSWLKGPLQWPPR